MTEQLEWNNGSLYILNKGRRKYVGTVVRNTFGFTWAIYIRGVHQRNARSEDKAKSWLERYAGEMVSDGVKLGVKS